MTGKKSNNNYYGRNYVARVLDIAIFIERGNRGSRFHSDGFFAGLNLSDDCYSPKNIEQGSFSNDDSRSCSRTVLLMMDEKKKKSPM